MLREHVRSVRGFSTYATVWQSVLTGEGVWKSQYAKERILIWGRCFCSWNARDLRISTQITLPRPESNDICSQMKAYWSDHIWGRRKAQHHRRWEDQCWFNKSCIRVRFIVNIEQRSFRSNHIYWCDCHIVVELQHLCSRMSLPSRFIRLV